MAVTHWAGLQLKVGEQLVHLAACAAVALAVLVTTRRRWAAVLAFTFLAFDPSNFGLNSSDVMRDNLFASLGVLALALGFLTTLGVVRRSHWVWVLLGAVSTGVVLAGYWLTREEGVTILPPLGVTVAVVAISAWGTARTAPGPSGTRLRPGRAPAPAGRRGAGRRRGDDRLPAARGAVAERGALRRGRAQRPGRGDVPPRVRRLVPGAGRARQPRIPISVDQRRAVYAVSPAARELRGILEDPGNQWRASPAPTRRRRSATTAGGGWPGPSVTRPVKTGHFADAGSGQEFFAPAVRADHRGLRRRPAGVRTGAAGEPAGAAAGARRRSPETSSDCCATRCAPALSTRPRPRSATSPARCGRSTHRSSASCR